MSDKLSTTIEDYLGVIYVLDRDHEPVTGVRLAELLGVSPPTVTNTLKRMVRDGLVSMDGERGPHLTEEGRLAAASLMRRHMLAEWMLARMVSWSKVHKEAHNMEHAISTEVEEALFAALNSPEFCPHGNPLPGNEDMATDWLPLTGAPLNTQLVIRRIHEFAEDNDLVMDFLEEHHISPGQQVWIREILAFNQTLDLCVENQVVSLGFPLARYIFAEPSSTPLAR